MALIIENKESLDALANTIIGSNKSVTEKNATKNNLIKMVNNIVPEKIKFSSGKIIPATEITLDNMPEIPFNLGNDGEGNLVIPDLIMIYQPDGISEGSGNVDATLITLLHPGLSRQAGIMGVYFSENKTTSGNLIGGTVGNINYSATRITDTSFFLAPRASYPWQAKKPIVWLQIKF